MGDFLPKCTFFYEIWVENRPKMPYSSFGEQVKSVRILYATFLRSAISNSFGLLSLIEKVYLMSLRFLLKLTIITPAKQASAASAFCQFIVSIPMQMLIAVATMGWQ